MCGLVLSDETTSLLEKSEFVVMLPAYSNEEMIAALDVAAGLIDLHCKEFCCVGASASELEDELDAILEIRGELSAVTTSFSNEIDAAEYFVFAADGARTKILVAMVDGHVGIEGALDRLLMS